MERSAPESERPFADEPSRLDPQELLAAAGGSVAAALVASRFGTSGTIVGAALGPVFVMIANHWFLPRLRRGLWRVPHRREIGLVLAAAALAFAMAMIAITAVEKLVGEPLSGIAGGGPDRGTTLSPGDGAEGSELEPPSNPTPEAEPRRTAEPPSPSERPQKTAPERTTPATPTTPTQTAPPPSQERTVPQLLPP